MSASSTSSRRPERLAARSLRSSTPAGRRRLLAAAGCALASLVAGCATQGGLAERAQRAGLPPAAEITATPFHPQTQYQCGPAALATVLGAAGVAASPSELVAEIYVPHRHGSLQPEIAAALRARGLLAYEAAPQLDDLLAELAAGRPVLVLQRLGFGLWPSWHYAVAVGYDADHVILRSGRDPRLQTRAAAFDTTWAAAERWAVIALRPGEMPARPDLARYVTAAAGLEAVGRYDEAAVSYRAAAERWPGQPLPILGLGNVAARRGEWREAEQAFRAVLQLDARQAAAINNRAEALARLGCITAARSHLEAGLATIAVDDPLRPALERTQQQVLARPSPGSGVEPPDCARFTSR